MSSMEHFGQLLWILVQFGLQSL